MECADSSSSSNDQEYVLKIALSASWLFFVVTLFCIVAFVIRMNLTSKRKRKYQSNIIDLNISRFLKKDRYASLNKIEEIEEEEDELFRVPVEEDTSLSQPAVVTHTDHSKF